jgi:hypothetical protein
MSETVRNLEIDALSKIVAQRRVRVESLGMMNVNGRDEADRMRLSMDYSQAQADLWNAESDLRLAIERQRKDSQ